MTTRWVGRTTLMLLMLTILVYALAFADAFLFRYRARQMFRLVENVPVGTPIESVRWIQDKYPPRFALCGNDSTIPLEIAPTLFEFTDQFGFRKFAARDLVMRPAWAGAGLKTDGQKVVGRFAALTTDRNAAGYVGTVATVMDPDRFSDHRLPPWAPKYSITGYDWFELSQRERIMKAGQIDHPGESLISVYPNAAQARRDAAYAFNFNCLWRWNLCDSTTSLVNPRLLHSTMRR